MFSLVRWYVYIELSAVIWNDMSVVGCRQSSFSYNVESSFAELRQTCIQDLRIQKRKYTHV
jgi:hypothetical protein